jgi:hypothetical protein
VGDNLIFIRDCFTPLYELVKELVLPGKYCSLTGTPGLGKSMFAYYLALRLLREENVAVIFMHMGWNETHLFLPEQVPEKVKAVLERFEPLEQKEAGWIGRFLATPFNLDRGEGNSAESLYSQLTSLKGDVVLILDPPRDFGHAVFTPPNTGMFIATSPRPARATSADAQGNVHDVFFPVWSLDEVKRLLRERKGSDLDSKEVEELEARYLMFGGVPRWIAKPGTPHEEMMTLALDKTTSAIASVTAATLVDLFNPRSTQPPAHSHQGGRTFP